MANLTEKADHAYEDVRAMNHTLINTKAMYPQDVYDILANLQAAGYGLQEVLKHLARTLEASLDECDVREDDGSNPGVNIVAAVAALWAAAEHARALGSALSDAQGLISRQSGQQRKDTGE